jgi:condensin-2 complex subunit H2
MVTTRGREATSEDGDVVMEDCPAPPPATDAVLEERKETATKKRKTTKKKKSEGGVEEEQANGMEKFKHLLEPIKNLAENWSVDIAVELEEYLEELEEISFEIPSVSSPQEEEEQRGGEAATKGFSFAKAALVIQGSTYVYSKKVEYLYALVLDAIDKVMDASKKKSVLRAARNNLSLLKQTGTDKDEDKFLLEGNEETYLNLDDFVAENTEANINLSAKDEDQLTLERQPMQHSAMLLALQSGQSSQAEKKQLEDKEDHGAFNLSAFTVHSSGALLIEGNEANLLDENLQPIQENPNDELDDDMMEIHEEAGGLDDAYYGDHMDDVNDIDGGDVGGGPFTPAADTFESDKEEEDPYAPLDPLAEGSLQERPFRRGKVQMKFKELADESLDFFSIPRKKHGTTFAEFKPALDVIQKARRAALLKQRRQEKAIALQNILDDEEEEGYHAEMQQHGVDDDYVDTAFVDFDAMSDQENFDFEVENPDAIMERGWNKEGGEANNTEERNASSEVSYEELCKSHIEKLMSAAALQAKQTNLAQRVYDWRRKIEPAITESNAHETFDIHGYGEDLVVKMKQAKEKQGDSDELLDFGGVVADSQRYEVCRAFAAMLQLVNDGNVDVKVDEADGSLKMELERTELRHKDLYSSYRAPSVLQEQTKNVKKAFPAGKGTPTKEPVQKKHKPSLPLDKENQPTVMS